MLAGHERVAKGMDRVISCLTGEHDWRLVLLAGAVSLMASLVAVSLFERARETKAQARAMWLAFAGAATGCGIWATHFIAILAYDPGVPVGYNLGLTVLSLIAAALVTWGGLSLAAAGPGRWAAPAGGALVGGGVASMHYTGMLAIDIPGHLTWHADLVVASLLMGTLFGAAALAVAARWHGLRATFAAAILLSTSVITHHFTAMGAVRLEFDPLYIFTGESVSQATLAIAVAAGAMAVLGVTLIAALADSTIAARARQFARVREQIIEASEAKLREQHMRLATALDSMSQGLVMFDKDMRLAACNRRYLEMFRMPPEIAHSRLSIQELIARHFDDGIYQGDREAHTACVVASFASDQPRHRIIETADGRVLSVLNCPLPDGGRVATQEDITDRRRTEERIREQQLLLDRAINNMSLGLIMFDKDMRLAVYNKRYLEMYGMSAEEAQRRPTIREVLHGHFARGVFKGDADVYVDSILREVKTDVAVTRIAKTADGRVISILNRQLDGGGRVATHEDITEKYRLQQAHERAQISLRAQKIQLDSALNNMAQGLVMFDAEARVVLCNRRYLDMYNLSPDAVKPGCTLRELLDIRKAAGQLAGDPEDHYKKIISAVSQDTAGPIEFVTTDGRTIRSLNHPMPGGGWVTTHEDITEQRATGEVARLRTLQLDTALDNMSQGLVMFDGNTRMILCNRRYIDMCRLPADRVKPGMLLIDLLELRAECGSFFADPQSYIARLRSALAEGKSFSITTELSDGRAIVIANQPMPGGGWVSTHDDITEQRQIERRLREQKLQLDTALNNMSQGLNLFDAEGRLVLCNERYMEMYRLTPEQVKPGLSVREMVEARIAAGTFFAVEPEPYIADLIETIKRREPQNVTMRVADGRIVSVISHPTPDGSGWVVTHEDISERRRAEIERDRSQAFATTVVEAVPSTIMVKDARDLRYVLVNRAAEAFLGITRDKIIGKTAEDIFSPQIAERIAQVDRDMLGGSGPQHFDEHPSEMPAGRHRIITTTRLPILDSQGDAQYLMTIIEDRTNRKRAEAQIAHMAHHDALTGLPNRAAFVACLEATIEDAARDGASFCLMSVDLDRLKEINDVFGHPVGDELLRSMSHRLQEAAGGAFLARLGGDEFTVIATDGEQPAAAGELADKLIAAVTKDFEIDDQLLRSSLTIGIAIFPADGDDATTLVANADAALYRAKQEGRGSYRFFEADMDKRLREQRALQHDLRSAIERAELTLHYQPQARISGEITGFEALVRWRHPVRGIIPPGAFIPLAEETGLIIPMGEWIMREACRQAATWPNQHNIGVNVSPVQFHHGDLANLLHTILLETGLSPQRLELEITEGVLIRDFNRAVAMLRRIKALGVRIAMDDFGTGYSSLSYLQAFPFDKIKIDRSFISNLESSAQSATIIRAVLGLARGLNLPVLAEGVETKEQLEFLASESCDEVQGYLIGRPRPIEEYAEITGVPKKRKKHVGAAAS